LITHKQKETMMSCPAVRIEVEYLGDLNCKVTHTPSGTSFLTDAPLDNNGQARNISPTDLLAASIASCISTIMGIKAKANNIDLSGMKVSAVKEMINEPFRRVSKLTIEVTFPRQLSEKEFQIMSAVAKTCPVTRSLLPEIEIEVTYKFAENSI